VYLQFGSNTLIYEVPNLYVTYFYQKKQVKSLIFLTYIFIFLLTARPKCPLRRVYLKTLSSEVLKKGIVVQASMITHDKAFLPRNVTLCT